MVKAQKSKQKASQFLPGATLTYGQKMYNKKSKKYITEITQTLPSNLRTGGEFENAEKQNNNMEVENQNLSRVDLQKKLQKKMKQFKKKRQIKPGKNERKEAAENNSEK